MLVIMQAQRITARPWKIFTCPCLHLEQVSILLDKAVINELVVGRDLVGLLSTQHQEEGAMHLHLEDREDDVV